MKMRAVGWASSVNEQCRQTYKNEECQEQMYLKLWKTHVYLIITQLQFMSNEDVLHECLSAVTFISPP